MGKILNMKLLLSILIMLNASYSAVKGQAGNSSELKGSISIVLTAGSSDAPFYRIVSPSLKGEPVFRGLLESTDDNNLTFFRVPDLLDPTTLSKPFKPGMLSCEKARVRAILDSDGNQTIASLELVFNGTGYNKIPDIFVDLPTGGSTYGDDYWEAELECQLESNGTIGSISILNGGKGYLHPPSVRIEGGAHYLRLSDLDSNQTGKFFRIMANDDASVILDNPLSEDLSTVFKPNSQVEIFEAWTLGSLLGYESTQLAMGDSSVADYVYLMKPSSLQDGTVNDFVAYFHNGDEWKSLDNESSSDNFGDLVIPPDQAIIIARRQGTPLDLLLSGTARTQSTFLDLPAFGERLLANNPFGIDIMLSDLIPTSVLTADSNDSLKWLTSESQEQADNIMILTNGIWETFWHDGTNMGITSKARATARAGSGVGGSLSQQDISMTDGNITGMTNPPTTSVDNVVVTSVGHGLRNGFYVHISGASGYKTNDSTPKVQVDEDGNEVADGQGLIIDSSANGRFLVVNCTADTFELYGKRGNCDFINNGTAIWSTGSSGYGYTSDALVSFVGGGGSGGAGIARIDGNGRVTSILITDSGAGYVDAPSVLIHSGGWRRMGAGQSPFNDFSISAGSGILLVRNSSSGVQSRILVSNPLQF